MGKYSVVGRVRPYALLLGALAFPAMAVAQTGNVANDPTSQGPVPHGTGGHAMASPFDQHNMPGGNFGSGTAPGAMPGFIGGGSPGEFISQGQQPGGRSPGHGPGMGHGPYGGSPFDGPGMSYQHQQPPAERMMGGAPYGDKGNGPQGQIPPRFGRGASQGSPSGRGPMMHMPSPSIEDQAKDQELGPWVGPGPGSRLPQGFPDIIGSMGSMGSCAHRSVMGHGMGHGGGMGGSGQPGMGAGISRLLQIPGLSKEQREKIHGISDEMRRHHWDLMGKNMDHSAKLRRLYGAEKLDAKAIGTAYGEVFDIKRKMIESSIEANQKALDVLTNEQREQFKSWGKPGF